MCELRFFFACFRFSTAYPMHFKWVNGFDELVKLSVSHKRNHLLVKYVYVIYSIRRVSASRDLNRSEFLLAFVHFG